MANSTIHQKQLMAEGKKVTGMKAGGHAKGKKHHEDEAQDRALFKKMMADRKAPMKKAKGGMTKKGC